MSDRKRTPEDDDQDLGEPVTDTLETLLEAIPDEGDGSESDDVDLGEPVTDRLKALLAELPEGALWEDDDDPDWDEPVTDKLEALLGALPPELLEGGDEGLGRPVTSELQALLGEPARGEAADGGVGRSKAGDGFLARVWRSLKAAFGK